MRIGQFSKEVLTQYIMLMNENENKERVTRDYLRQMQDGETRTVHCSTPQEIESAASIAYQFSGNEGSTYKVSRNKAELTVTITKEAQ